MTHTIRIDEEVFEALKIRAEAFVDSPNDVLRRLLGLDRKVTRQPVGKNARVRRQDRMQVVQGELIARGYVPTADKTKSANIVATKNGRSVRLIAVTQRGLRKAWLLNKKAENRHGGDLFYVFMNVGLDSSSHDFYIVPSKEVADFVRTYHATWLATPGRRGQPHKDTLMRMFKDPKAKYLERWNLLES